jgi:hypothetical protein
MLQTGIVAHSIRRYYCILYATVIIVIIFILFFFHTNGFRSRRELPQVSGYSGYIFLRRIHYIYSQRMGRTEMNRTIVRITFLRITFVTRAHALPLIGIRPLFGIRTRLCRWKTPSTSMHRTRFLSGHGRLRGRCLHL